MSGKCSKCSMDFVSGSEVISCVECHDSFHPLCTRIKTVEAFKKMGARKMQWKCDSCKLETVSVSSRSTDVDAVEVNPIVSAIEKLREDMNRKLDDKFEQVQNSIAGVKGEISDIKSELLSLKVRNESLCAEVDKLKEENNNLKADVSLVFSQLHELQQYSRINNLLVSGIPVTQGENVYELLKNLAEVVGTPYRRTDICTAHRLKGRKSDPRPPSIVVRFVSRSVKCEWLAARKAKGTLSTTELRGSMKKNDIYLNEHLTPMSRAIFNRARHLVKTKQMLYAWVRDCKVFTKTNEDSPVVHIQHLSELPLPLEPASPAK